jgi:hypothetical protein
MLTQYYASLYTHLILPFCMLQASTDLWLVTEDYTARSDRELSVSRGQQVELIDAHPPNAPPPPMGSDPPTQWYLIRLANPDTADWASAEGMVPMTVLKQLPGLRGSGSRTSITIDSDATGGGKSGDSVGWGVGVIMLRQRTKQTSGVHGAGNSYVKALGENANSLYSSNCSETCPICRLISMITNMLQLPFHGPPHGLVIAHAVSV